jgi:hypothetical protein
MLSGYGADRALSALGRQKPAQNPSRTPGSLRYIHVAEVTAFC